MNGDRTVTVTIATEANTETSSNTQLLRLVPEKTVAWSEDTVDNENMNKKSSKSCCIFHKKRDPDDSSDSEHEKSCDKHKDAGKTPRK